MERCGPGAPPVELSNWPKRRNTLASMGDRDSSRSLARFFATLADSPASDRFGDAVCQLARRHLAVDAAAFFVGDDRPERLGSAGFVVEPAGFAVEPAGFAVEPAGLAVEPAGLAVEPAGLAAEPPPGVPASLAAADLARLQAWAIEAGYRQLDLALLTLDTRPRGLLALFSRAGAPLAPAELDLLGVGLSRAFGQARSAGGAAAPTGATHRVLLVEDDPDNREAMASLLAVGGFEVVSTDCGAAGLRAFAAGAFDVVLTDLGLPDMDGWHVAGMIKQTSPATPVALITGWGLSIDRDEMRRRGVDLLVKKPLDPRAFLEHIETLAQAGVRKPRA